MKKAILLFIAFQTLMSGCCFLKPIKVGEECVSCDQLCAGEHSFNKCAPDGVVTRLFVDGGLPVTDSIDGSEYLGRVWNPAVDPSMTSPCLDKLGDIAYSTTYQKDTSVYTLKLKEVQAAIEGKIKGVLVASNVSNSPEIAANIAVAVSNTLQSNNYDKFNFKILTLKNDIIDNLDDHKKEPYIKCYNKLSDNDKTYFIRSVAVIGSENKFSSISNTTVSGQIDAVINNAKISGSTINADLSAALKASIKLKIDQTINSEIIQHSRIYGLGFSLPYDVDSTRYKKCEQIYGCDFNEAYTRTLLFNNMVIQ